MKLTANDIEMLYELPINDQIIAILKVPTEPILGKEKAGRILAANEVQEKNSQDLLFILTADFNCMLLSHCNKQGLTTLSTGNISDLTGQKREPPYSVFLGSNGKYIGLMLYENIIKIIPIVKQGNKISLSNAFNVRIRHPEAHQVIPLFEDESAAGNSALSVFYQQQIHKNQ